MTFYRSLVGVGLLVALVLVIMPFWNVPVLTTNNEFIASYGSYLSGTLGPLISALAFIALLKTLYLQQEQLKQSALESQKNSLQIVLNKSEEHLDKGLLRHDISVNFENNKYEYRDLLLLEFFGALYEEYLPRKGLVSKGQAEWVTIMGQEIMQLADLNLLRLAAIVKRYDKLCAEDTMYQYYSAKYYVLIERLDSLGYLSEENQKFWKKA
ncbi:hypothetical protein OC523_006510 [Vibrio vulnificus]|nr:hypothetical protein [Vibrio vulnificus]